MRMRERNDAWPRLSRLERSATEEEVKWQAAERGNICTRWHGPSVCTRGSRRAAPPSLAACDLPEAPGALVLLKARCASFLTQPKHFAVQLFT
ncbi:hypothetical protein AAFF_G00243830 [Aldrovandia affinis]|uniref:Uncharacterized protein n=1 Tax=Aldrovandia affinis TaxID=143900 RepID=A0AAD7W3H3_9TELE|nr:hypothetical protein AAFF_G00243830 [Aldrovandia affinis]